MSKRRLITRVGKKLRSMVKRLKSRFSWASTIKIHYAFFYKHCKVNHQRMLLESFNGKGVSDSAYAVLQELIAQGRSSNYEIYFGSTDPQRDQPFVDDHKLPVKLVKIASIKYAYIIATSRYLLTNTSFPAYFIRRPEQIVVNTWHGTPLKTLGKRMRLGMQSMFLAQHTFFQASWITFPNEFTRMVIMRDYNLDQLYTGKIAMVGYPRNSVFMQGQNDVLRRRFDLDKHENFAYMPTWRGKSTQSVDVDAYVSAVIKLLAEIDGQLSDNQRLYVNLHPLVAGSVVLDKYEHVLTFPRDVSTYDFLSQMDVLITDYSSVMFDYALTRRPVILFTYDEEEYLEDRGLYFPLSDLPFAKVRSVDELMACIDERRYVLPSAALREFENEFLSYDSPHNARQVLSLLLGKAPADLPVIDYSTNQSHIWNIVEGASQKTRADMDGIFSSADSSSDIILLQRSGFGPVKSAYVAEHHAEECNFVFVTDSLPRTFIEDVTRKFWPPAQRRLAARERKRVLGDLPTVEDPVVIHTVGTKGYRYRPEVVSVRASSKDKFEITLRIQSGTFSIDSVGLRKRSDAHEQLIGVPFAVVERNEWLRVKVAMAPEALVFDGPCWDLVVLVSERSGKSYELACFASRSFKRKLYVQNIQYVLSDGNVLFPYAGLNDRVCLYHRELSPFDKPITRVKEWLAAGIYFLTLPYWKVRRPWLVFEKNCSYAQDNGYAFFAYCMGREAGEASKRVYYVIKHDKSDYAHVSRFGTQVIDFMSFRHMVYLLAATLYVGSDAKAHLYQWQPKKSLIVNMMSKKKMFFLQHGVTALKRVDYLFGMHGSLPMTYFLTTSQKEQDIVVEHFDYDTGHAPILGFSRWDLLQDTSDVHTPTILLMPTWRPWLEGVSDETFLQSDYYASYSSLLADERLDAMLDSANAKLKFFIHPKLGEYLHQFESRLENIELVASDSQPLNELIQECSLLITDYSSVCWDVLYLDKPVVFYQFDQQRYLDEIGSYIDLDESLPGPLCRTEDDLRKVIHDFTDAGYSLGDDDRQAAGQWFERKDRQNRRRTLDFLLKEGY